MASNTKKSKLAKQQAATKARREQKRSATTTTPKSSTTSAKPVSKAEQKKQSQNTAVKVAAVIFAVLLAGSMMLPSCSAIFAGRVAQQAPAEQETQTEATDETTDEGETTDESETGTEPEEELTGIELADSQYQPLVDELKAKLDENPDDLASILNLGNYYMSWATAADSYAYTDEENLYVSDLFDEAVSYFDRYLELNPSNDVTSRRALCEFYAGDVQPAIKDLEAFTAEVTDYGPAWVYLGMMYESTGASDKAEQAYLKATEADPDDLYGSRSYATERIAALNDDGSDSSETTTAPTGSSLQDVLSSASGTGY